MVLHVPCMETATDTLAAQPLNISQHKRHNRSMCRMQCVRDATMNVASYNHCTRKRDEDLIVLSFRTRTLSKRQGRSIAVDTAWILCDTMSKCGPVGGFGGGGLNGGVRGAAAFACCCCCCCCCCSGLTSSARNGGRISWRATLCHEDHRPPRNCDLDDEQQNQAIAPSRFEMPTRPQITCKFVQRLGGKRTGFARQLGPATVKNAQVHYIRLRLHMRSTIAQEHSVLRLRLHVRQRHRKPRASPYKPQLY